MPIRLFNYDNPFDSCSDLMRIADMLGYVQRRNGSFFFANPSIVRLPLVYRIPCSPTSDPQCLLERSARAAALSVSHLLQDGHAVFFPPVCYPSLGDALIATITTIRGYPPQTVVWDTCLRRIVDIRSDGVWLLV
jgi:hypothetical protein